MAVKHFFDTSVLVAAFLEAHSHHEASLAAYETASRRSACCAAHSLAEVYSTLTRMPLPIRVNGEQAKLFLESIDERLTLIALEPEEYLSTIMEAADLGVVGGRIYDALLARCALKSKAEIIYTWDVGHFHQLGTEVARKVRTP
jgi:predicted nucleic acid-binding protein